MGRCHATGLKAGVSKRIAADEDEDEDQDQEQEQEWLGRPMERLMLKFFLSDSRFVFYPGPHTLHADLPHV